MKQQTSPWAAAAHLAPVSLLQRLQQPCAATAFNDPHTMQASGWGRTCDAGPTRNTPKGRLRGTVNRDQGHRPPTPLSPSFPPPTPTRPPYALPRHTHHAPRGRRPGPRAGRVGRGAGAHVGRPERPLQPVQLELCEREREREREIETEIERILGVSRGGVQRGRAARGGSRFEWTTSRRGRLHAPRHASPPRCLPPPPCPQTAGTPGSWSEAAAAGRRGGAGGRGEQSARRIARWFVARARALPRSASLCPLPCLASTKQGTAESAAPRGAPLRVNGQAVTPSRSRRPRCTPHPYRTHAPAPVPSSGLQNCASPAVQAQRHEERARHRVWLEGARQRHRGPVAEVRALAGTRELVKHAPPLSSARSQQSSFSGASSAKSPAFSTPARATSSGCSWGLPPICARRRARRARSSCRTTATSRRSRSPSTKRRA